MIDLSNYIGILEGLLVNPLIDDYLIQTPDHPLPTLYPEAVRHVDEVLYRQLSSLIDDQHVLDATILSNGDLLVNGLTKKALSLKGYCIFAWPVNALYLGCSRFVIRLS